MNYILNYNWSQLVIRVAGSVEEKSCSGLLTETSDQLKNGPEGFRKTSLQGHGPSLSSETLR